MKKNLLACFILLLPCFAFAQSDNPLADDVFTGINGITNIVQLDDHIDVMQINTGNDSFDLVAYNDNWQEVWHTTIAGYGISVGKFKNKILAVAATEHGTLKGNNNTYKASLIDPADGKTLIEKVIYEDNNDFIEIPEVLIGDTYFKFAVRQTNATRKMHVGIPVFFIFQMTSWSKELNETQKLNITDFNEKLEPVNTVKPVVMGTFITITCNKNADMFVSWLNGSDIEVYKYDAGKNAPSAQFNTDVSIKPNNDANLEDRILFTTSKTKPGDLYYAMLYLNEDKDVETIVGKMDFLANTKKAVTQVFKKADLKALEKGFVPVNKKLDDPDMSSPRSLNIKNFIKTDNSLILTLGGDYSVVSSSYSYNVGMSLILNVFDDDLKPKFQQLFPIRYYDSLGLGMHAIQNELCVVANNRHSKGNVGVYGILNLDNGQWDKMYFLTKKDIKGYLDGSDILWFGHNFIAPYMISHGMFGVKYNLSLQQNNY